MNESKESRLSVLLIIGGGMMLVSIPVTLMLIGGAAGRMAMTQGGDPGPLLLSAFGPMLFVAGLLLVGGTIGYGLLTNRRTTKDPVRRQLSGVRVQARYAILKQTGELLFYDFDPEMDGLKFYARLELPGGGSGEYQCSHEVWSHCGEGLRGDAVIQGDWLGQFIPTPPGSS